MCLYSKTSKTAKSLHPTAHQLEGDLGFTFLFLFCKWHCFKWLPTSVYWNAYCAIFFGLVEGGGGGGQF